MVLLSEPNVNEMVAPYPRFDQALSQLEPDVRLGTVLSNQAMDVSNSARFTVHPAKTRVSRLFQVVAGFGMALMSLSQRSFPLGTWYEILPWAVVEFFESSLVCPPKL